MSDEQREPVELEEPERQWEEVSRDTNSEALDEYLEQVTYILKGGEARFVPQWDEQVIGHQAARAIIRDYYDPPKPSPPTELQLYPCESCELVWIGGSASVGLTQIHPSHRNLLIHPVNPCRSILAYVKGACSGNGTNDTKAAIGVYFGSKSSHNRSMLIEKENPSFQAAEIAAMVEAMRYARTVIIPRRKEILRESLNAQGSRLSSFIASSSFITSNESAVFRLVIATDYWYLVECLCRPSPLTKMRHQSREQFQSEHVPKDREGFNQLLVERRRLSTSGALVVWYYVEPSFNSNAKALAESALRSASTNTE
ncbi:hypothetical protein TWF730_005982 [Orbilia blumenaviensis]|uniref:RNase H type-1 domain-containing protein n=1 Tax=Orbilia blumenaviensis TaxID=1796055 RepID=A0AAV9VM62_9PEZI